MSPDRSVPSVDLPPDGVTVARADAAARPDAATPQPVADAPPPQDADAPADDGDPQMVWRHLCADGCNCRPI